MATRTRSVGAWTITRAACRDRTPPHRMREVIPGPRGNSVVCLLCGATLELNGRVLREPPRRAA